jgi:hypothetical protein
MTGAALRTSLFKPFWMKKSRFTAMAAKLISIHELGLPMCSALPQGLLRELVPWNWSAHVRFVASPQAA